MFRRNSFRIGDRVRVSFARHLAPELPPMLGIVQWECVACHGAFVMLDEPAPDAVYIRTRMNARDGDRLVLAYSNEIEVVKQGAQACMI